MYRGDCFDAQALFTMYSNADHAGNLDNQRSTGGYVLLGAGTAVSGSSRLQTTVAL